MKYWNSQYPFTAFAALSFKSGTKCSEISNILNKTQILNDMTIALLGSPKSQTEILIHSQHNIHGKFEDFIFSGSAILHGKYVMGGKDVSNFNDIDDLNVGQFSLIKFHKKGFIAKTDLFGHGQLFIWQSEQFSILSNRSHLLSLILKEIGQKTLLNKTVAATFFAGQSTLFSQQFSSDQMLTQGISLVRPDCTVLMKQGDLRYKENKAFSGLFKGKNKNYHSYLNDGVEQLVGICDAIINDERFTKVIVDLSGGKDSRMVFAAVNRVSNWQNRCQISAKDVPNSQDLQIACGLAGLVNAAFDDGMPIAKNAMTLSENLDIWRSSFYGSYHRLGAHGWSHRGQNLSTINLSGGNGEAARGFWSKIFERQLEGFDLDKVSIDQVAAKIVRATTFKETETTEDMIDVFATTLKSMPRDSILDKLDLHYIYYRNRAHFGMREFSTYSNQQTFFPLLAPSLIKAAWSLPAAERIKNKVVSDTLNALNPIWTSFEFDGGEILDGPLSHVANNISSDITAWREANLSAEAARKSAQGRAAMRWADWPVYLREEALKIANTAIDNGVVSEETVLRTLERTDTRIGQEFASKLFAVHVAVNP